MATLKALANVIWWLPLLASLGLLSVGSRPRALRA